MAPEGGRLIIYHQTHHTPDGTPVSLLPLITYETGITHVIIAAFHLNEQPGHITLNNDAPSHERYSTLWAEMSWLQGSGVKVLAMLGGAAKGTFAKLDGRDFEEYYIPLRDALRTHNFNGIDLDIEEEFSLPAAYRLIDRLRMEFGPEFIITLAPVATALLPNMPHLSGKHFDYFALEAARGDQIAWYNTQFYNGWGEPIWFASILAEGWKPEKIVIGLLTNPLNGGSGYVSPADMEAVLVTLRAICPTLGGVMGWEYFNALPGGCDRPWDWVMHMRRTLRAPITEGSQVTGGSVLSAPPHPFPPENVAVLADLGFSQQQAVAALNMTNGNVELAAGLLFD
ncbi:glycoside hydrolase family 18 protein [Piedraia hortae CBS 480.64]|uniref:chitinase n=1 Tax=Piedraia hortae CBS 480.64 TaxID=1314780 RepID=A0A6A7BTV7_9PEZI|nr:glycoside hydrolase family 18 protein [Piedraia hortae CBS 480.64]